MRERLINQSQTEAFECELRKSFRSFGIERLEEEQIKRLVNHYELLCKWNQRFNLTRINKPREAATLNYAESLYGARFIAQAKTMLDIGSGAGFPAVPISIALPQLSVTALEANQKKSLFLTEVKFDLPLDNFRVITARLEDIDCAGYDLLTCRALDRARAILPSIIRGMTEGQRLMLYCVQDLVDKLESLFPVGFNAEVNHIPQSEGRLIAIFSRDESLRCKKKEIVRNQL